MIGYLATATSLLGMYLLPTHKKAAIILFLVGNVVWLVWGYQTGTYSIILNYVIMGILNARTLVKWMKEAQGVVA